jgi:hypothetical protein
LARGWGIVDDERSTLLSQRRCVMRNRKAMIFFMFMKYLMIILGIEYTLNMCIALGYRYGLLTYDRETILFLIFAILLPFVMAIYGIIVSDDNGSKIMNAAGKKNKAVDDNRTME